MECIICKDSGSESIQDNTHCKCKYKYHSSCWIDYIHSKNKITCPLCRIDISIKSLPKPTLHTPLIQATAPPYAVQNTASEQQITYQEFVVIVEQYNTSRNTNNSNIQRVPIESPRHLSIPQKVIKVIIGLSILAIIAIIFVIMNFT